MLVQWTNCHVEEDSCKTIEAFQFSLLSDFRSLFVLAEGVSQQVYICVNTGLTFS